MRDRLEAYKPAASARVHLLLAATMWAVVGGFLLFFGARWGLSGRIPHGALWLAGAILAGWLKARLVLERAARRIVERIRTRGDGRCLGGFLSLRSWGFILLMVALGRFLRGGLVPRAILGLIYAGVGTALLVASRRLWYAWYRRNER